MLAVATGTVPLQSYLVNAQAETPSFGELTLAPGFEPQQAVLSGHTGGSFSLAAIANRDRANRVCLGYSDPTPDHIVVLKRNFSYLQFRVNSAGADTTLLVHGPNKSAIRCGDDTGSSKDASLEDQSWPAGTYRIWVGLIEPGIKRNYTLSIGEGAAVLPSGAKQHISQRTFGNSDRALARYESQRF